MKPDGECLRAKEWEVRQIPRRQAMDLIESHHYAKGGSNTAVATHGLFKIGDERCWGAAQWLPPTRNAAKFAYPDAPENVLALSRLVLVPEAPKNAATFFIRRSIDLLPERWVCLVTYADDWQGHSGTIYHASGWEYLGKTTPQKTYVLNGRRVARLATKSRTDQQMLDLGAECIGSFAKHRFRLVRKPSRC